ncbi:SPOR domain-containing protein [Pontibaca salina]|uniref:SPOR domain-containing protein n=1 Tax=Pontibaca salina TaxID=2795731 RepID=A0A934M1N4_9RHOB|nr:SPOR domain-containing protein [Pontibaca salina]MBI6629816.1 SPOR domain-containing protein [Pontibaca salina]
MEYYDDRQDAPAGPPGLSSGIAKLVNVAGAVASLALVVGIAFWGYKLIMRDVSGVPVVRAIEGPVRTQPEDPGGQAADHQGLAVNRVAAKGSAAPTADTLRLAPRPVALAPEDAPMASFRPDAAADDADAENAGQIDGDADVDARENSDSTAKVRSDGGGSFIANPDADRALDKNDSNTAGPASFPAGSIDAVLAELVGDGDAQPAKATAGVQGPGVAVSRRPLNRPGNLVAEVSAPVKVTQTITQEVAADSLVPGTPLVQLGALESPEAARAEWARLAARFDDYLSDKSRVIQEASSGGRNFYRLRAMGFEDIAAARRFCAVLIAEQAECIPVAAK